MWPYLTFKEQLMPVESVVDGKLFHRKHKVVADLLIYQLGLAGEHLTQNKSSRQDVIYCKLHLFIY